MDPGDLKLRLFRFALDVGSMLQSLEDTGQYQMVRNQLKNSSAISCENYLEAQLLGSGSDFEDKIHGSLKEMRESNCLLRILSSAYKENSQIVGLIGESNELKNLLLSLSVEVSTEF